jgi:hypothetical protein
MVSETHLTGKAFYQYCDLATSMRQSFLPTNTGGLSFRWNEQMVPLAFKSPYEQELKKFNRLAMGDARARGLGLEAYMLCPPQRLARYPLLLQVCDPSLA